MSEVLTGVVVSHGALSEALVDAVNRITGDAEALVAVSNDGCSRDSLVDRVQRAVGGRQCLMFVDLPGGSCFHAALRFKHECPSVAVVAGVNLAMLLDFVQHRDRSLTDAAARAAEVGGKAIQVAGV